MGRLFGVLFYGLSSIIITIVNKIILNVWGFPSVSTLVLAQFIFSILSLRILKVLGIIDFPFFSIRMVFPLPILYVGNALSGLSGTKSLSIPMFTVLRRTNMIFTMGLEICLLRVQYSFKLKLSVVTILFGSILAAISDTQIDYYGYIATLLNNLFTSFNGVVAKSKLDDKQIDSVWGLMYMNSLLGTPLLFLILMLIYPETVMDAYHFEHWNDPLFVLLFLISSSMGTILQYSILYCTKVNSALTVVVTGVLKNVLTSYIGMFDSRLGYTFDLMNFIGINLSMFGGIWYAFLQYNDHINSEDRQSIV